MKSSDALVLAHAEVQHAIATLGRLEKLLGDVLDDIERAETQVKKERKLFRGKK